MTFVTMKNFKRWVFRMVILTLLAFVLALGAMGLKIRDDSWGIIALAVLLFVLDRRTERWAQRLWP